MSKDTENRLECGEFAKTHCVKIGQRVYFDIVEADIDGLKILLKEKKTILKKINKEIAGLEDKKRQQDEAALKKAQKEQISIAIQQLLDTGVSMDDVLSRLKG